MRRHGWILALLFGFSLAAAAPVAATDAVLGSAGELYVVRAGAYGTLFPTGAAADRDSTVLALDIARPGAAPQRMLVPGTEGEELERLPSLIYEEASDTVYLVWEKRSTPIHPVLMLSGYEDGEWLEPVEVIGNYYADKTSPQIALTHEIYPNPSVAGQPPTTTHRTILHVVWGEEIVVTGLYETFYTALVFENGSYAGKSPVYNLNQLDNGNSPATSFETAANLVSAPKLASGRDERTVAVAFASATTRRMISLEVDVLPAQLSRLADEARAYIIDIGTRATAPDARSVADRARAYIIDIGVAFQPEVRRSIAELVHTFIRNSGTTLDANAIRSLADGARAYIIDIGAKLSGRGLQTVNATSTTPPTIREVDPASLTQTPGERRPPLLFQFRMASSRPAPRVGGGEISVFVSKTGRDVLIAWQETGRVVYRESSGDGWSDPLELKLSPSLDARRAYEMLEQRVRNR